MRRTLLPLFLIPLLLACGKDPAPRPEGTANAEGVPAVDEPYKATATAPASFKVKFATTKGDFVIEATRDWAPNGVDRLYNLVRIGFFTDLAIYRVIPGFVAQFGIHGDPDVSSVWRNATIEPDPVKVSNERGTVTFAMRKLPTTRTAQIFVNLKNNAGNLDPKGFAPIARVVEGMEVVDSFYQGYKNDVPQQNINAWGNRYLKKEFPNLDYIKSATLILP